MKVQNGVTLLEVLMTISLLVIVLTIGITFVQPNVQLGRARDTERRSEVRALQLAISQYQRDNNGNIPTGIPLVGDPIDLEIGGVVICQPGCTTQSGQIDISDDILGYFENGIPVDPAEEGDQVTGYRVQVTTSGTIIVSAPNTERGDIISTQ